MSKKHQLASLQLAIMHVLWDRGEATVADVRAALGDDRPLAHTTVVTMLTKMERKGQVAHRSDGRINVYRPLIAKAKVSRSMLRDLSERLFLGDVTALVSQLLDGQTLDRREIQRLKSLIREKEKEIGHGR